MGKKETVEALINGGKASAAPPLGPALGPMGVNIGQVVADINKKTASFAGMQVPIKVIIDTESKEYEIIIGTPPASALIKKEANIQKGASNPRTDKVADIKIEQTIKIAIMKEDSLAGADLKAKIKEVIGTCNSMGVLVEGEDPKQALRAIEAGRYDEMIKARKTELSAEEMKKLEEERKKMEADLKARKAEYLATGKKILEENESLEKAQKIAKLVEAKIPQAVIDELLPKDKAAPKTDGGKKK